MTGQIPTSLTDSLNLTLPAPTVRYFQYWVEMTRLGQHPAVAKNTPFQLYSHTFRVLYSLSLEGMAGLLVTRSDTWSWMMEGISRAGRKWIKSLWSQQYQTIIEMSQQPRMSIQYLRQ